MLGQETQYGRRFECIINGRDMIVYEYAGQYIGYPEAGSIVMLDEKDVVAGVHDKFTQDIEKYNADSPTAYYSRGVSGA